MMYYPSEELNNFHPAGFSHFAEALESNKDDDIADMEIGSLRTAHHLLSVRYLSSDFPTNIFSTHIHALGISF